MASRAFVFLFCIGYAFACTSVSVDCGDGAVVTGRTIDFAGLSVTKSGSIYSISAGTEIPLTAAKGESDTDRTLTSRHAYVDFGATFIPGSRPLDLDGMNDVGLAVGALWQSNVTFYHAYSQSGPPNAIFVMDVGDVILSNFSTVQEVRDYFRPDNVQITTQIYDEATANSMKTLFGVDPDIPKPSANNTFHIGLHFHVTDSSGDGLLIEATPDGSYALYDTKVLTNEPAWPDMVAQHEAYMKYDFSSVPGVPAKSIPPGLPLVIPFNSMVDSLADGYFGSQSRNLRMMLQIENCDKYPWVDAGWSPGYTGLMPPDEMSLSSFTALKRTENYLASVVVPTSQLVGNSSEYGTEIAFLKDQTDLIYYYKTPRDSTWTGIDLNNIERDSGVAIYSMKPKNQPFSEKAIPEPSNTSHD